MGFSFTLELALRARSCGSGGMVVCSGFAVRRFYCSSGRGLASLSFHILGGSLPVCLVVKWLRCEVLRVWRCCLISVPLCRVLLGFSKGVVYDSWMVSLRASSPQSSSARSFSILLHLKAMFLVEWCLCSVKMFFSVWHQSGFQLRVLLLRFSKTSSDVAALSCSRWSISTLCSIGLVLGGDSKPALLDGFSPLWLVDALEVFRKLFLVRPHL
ncbi:hypothetical protein DY000_02013244 [Brassica cretica]|uniref:Uncharacterized protein n=1 Tax=Brassica cretica TaxID=69181 RepID=A0ABQ7DBB6_BRACR|nr:hypothetical protein DY000_02013244 [Brassica cretica]